MSVGDGAVSEAGTEVIYIGKFIPGMWVGTWFERQQPNRQSLDADRDPNMV